MCSRFPTALAARAGEDRVKEDRRRTCKREARQDGVPGRAVAMVVRSTQHDSLRSPAQGRLEAHQESSEASRSWDCVTGVSWSVGCIQSLPCLLDGRVPSGAFCCSLGDLDNLCGVWIEPPVLGGVRLFRSRGRRWSTRGPACVTFILGLHRRCPNPVQSVENK